MTSPFSMRSRKIWSGRSTVPTCGASMYTMVPSRPLNGNPTLLDSSMASAQSLRWKIACPFFQHEIGLLVDISAHLVDILGVWADYSWTLSHT